MREECALYQINHHIGLPCNIVTAMDHALRHKVQSKKMRVGAPDKRQCLWPGADVSIGYGMGVMWRDQSRTIARKHAK